MASFEAAESVTLLAGSDFTGDIYKLARMSTSVARTADLATELTDTIIGVIGEEVTAGEECPIIMLKGIVKMVAGAAVTVGELVIPHSTDGTVEGATNIGALLADTMAVGIAVTAAANAGDIFEVLAMPLTSATET